MILDPEIVFLDVGGVDDQKKMISLELLVNQKVINCSTIGVQHHSIEDLTGSHRTHIICEHMIHEFLSVRAAYENLSHVGHIKHADLITDGKVLLGDGRILDRHVKAGERTHLRS